MSTRSSSQSDSSSRSSATSGSIPSSRATTPPTDVESISIRILWLLDGSPEPGRLLALFKDHSRSNLLGVCLPSSTALTSEEKASRFVANCLGLKSADVKGAPNIFYEVPFKYSYFESSSASMSCAQHLNSFSDAGLRPIISKSSPCGELVLYILESPAAAFPSQPAKALTAPGSKELFLGGNVPTLTEWMNLWKAWDLVTLGMIPPSMLHQRPIDLRHKCLFYIGHIPTFLDMLLCKAVGGKPSEPAYFWNIFERGIDPHVDDPDHCHNHSEVPKKDEDWPTLQLILQFRDNVRAKLVRLYDDLDSGKIVLTRKVARTLVMCLEHEGFHIETLLYMLIQRGGCGTLPPPGFTHPPWDVLKLQWDAIVEPKTKTVVVGPASVVLGHDDSEADDAHLSHVPEHEYGWDNENPRRTVAVSAFRAEWRPITNGEFLDFMLCSGRDPVEMPKSWTKCGDDYKVLTFYGPVSMEVARKWPVLTSFDNLEKYALSKGGRLPSEAELRLFLDCYEIGHEGGGNSGFRHFHPMPATTGQEYSDGRGSNGGVWEWSTSKFAGHDGLVPTKLFTGYSEDFFDNKHLVVLGASYATIPRLADRRSVRNFYQHNYPYPWVGARVVYDL